MSSNSNKEQLAEKRVRVYVCGPMTGLPDFNRPAFRAAASILIGHGYDCVCPADFKQEGTWEELMRHAIPEMLACDRVVVLVGWERSRGARLEVFIARELGLKVDKLGDLERERMR